MIFTHLHVIFYFLVESGIQLKEPGSHEQLESEIQVLLKKKKKKNWNPESTAWNPESKALFDSLISGDIGKRKENQRSKICLETEQLDSHSYGQSRNILI